VSFEWLYISQFLFVVIAMFLAGYSKALKLPDALVLLYICLALHGAFSRLPFASDTLFATFSYALAFMYGPLVYLTVCSLLDTSMTLTKQWLIVFVPPLSVLVLLSAGLDHSLFLGCLLLSIQLASIAFSFKEVRVFRYVYDQARAQSVLPAQKWIQTALVIYAFINVILFLRAISGDVYVNDTRRLMNLLVSVSIALSLSYVVYRLTKNPEWIPQLTKEERRISTEKPAASEDNDVAQWAKEIERYITQHKPYLDPEISVRKLAKQLDWPIQQVSMVINQHYQCSFSEKINRERVNEAERLIKDPMWKDRSLLDVAFEAGFNSKASFNVMFKRHAGKTPREYRKSLIG
jgi:AraC-like DNA-binding protein